MSGINNDYQVILLKGDVPLLYIQGGFASWATTKIMDELK